MKLSEIKDEDALDVLADILEPASEIISDERTKEAFEEKDMLKLSKTIIKNHKKAIIEILARLDNVPVEEFHCNFFTLPKKVLEIISDADLVDFFSFSGGAEQIASSDATEVTQETDEK